MRSSVLFGERLVVPAGVLWQEKMIILQGKVQRDFYQLPADKPVEHLSIRLLVLQLYQDQQNHNGVGLDLPRCLLSHLVFSKFLPLSFVISAVTSQQAAGTRYTPSDHPVGFSTSDTQK